MLKIYRITRYLGEDTTEFHGCGHEFRLIARPIQLWKHVDWNYWGENDLRHFALQTPWITLVRIKRLN